MIKVKRNILVNLIFFLLLISLEISSQEKTRKVFNFFGEIRFRYEYYDNFTLKGYSPNEIDKLLLERIRLNFEFDLKEKGKIFIQLQDAHPFLTKFGESDFKTSNPIKDTIDIRQFYYEKNNINGGIIGFKFGRQQISYGDQRIFGPGNWGNTGRYAWDAVMININGSPLKSDLWFGKYLLYKSNVWPNHPVSKFLTFVNYNKVQNLPFSFDFFYVLKRNTSEKILSELNKKGNLTSHSIGFQMAKENIASFNLGATFVYQFGKHSQDLIKSYGYSAKIGYTFGTLNNMRIEVKYTFGSGDSNPKDGTYETFDGVFGGADLYYGFMNFFFWANLRDFEINSLFNLKENFTVSFDYHKFLLSSNKDGWYLPSLTIQKRNLSEKSSTDIGNEFDLRFSYKTNENFSFLWGISKFNPLRFIKENYENYRNANWYYIQMVYSF